MGDRFTPNDARLGGKVPEVWLRMTTPSNQELLEMIQVLQDQNFAQQRAINNLNSQITLLENDLDDADNRTNLLIGSIVVKNDWNEGLEILRRIGALNDTDIRRARL